MEERQHALLSASGSKRWLTCTPSARLEETLPEKESEYANEGRLAHEVAELVMRKVFLEPMNTRTFNSRMKKLKENPLYQDEMVDHCNTYVDYIEKIVHSFTAPPYIAVEKRLNYSTYAPEGFGTGDTVIISENTLYLFDYKYGKGVPVSAEMNTQMMLYALGALAEYSILYNITEVIVAIVQPRLESISEFRLTADELLAWGDSIKPIAQMAFEGFGVFVQGDHCQFCRAKALCRARADFNTELEDYAYMKPPLISNAEVGVILLKAQQLAAWVSDLEEYALAEILKGGEIDGWKAVEGRAVRKFTDIDAVINAAKAKGFDEAVLYKREPITLTAFEKLLGKAAFTETLTPFVTVPQGKPTLAPLSDRREPYTLRTDAAEDFKNEVGGIGNE